MAVDFALLRQRMVDNQIRTVDVTSLSVLEAFLLIPREDFVPLERREFAYLDGDIELLSRQEEHPRYLMEPAPLARLLQLADISSQDRVLDVGAATGYTAALLGRLGGMVVAVESEEPLIQQARSILAAHGDTNIELVHGALPDGCAEKAPYDVIFIEGAVDFVPDSLFNQLGENGRLVVVEGHGNLGVARLYVKTGGVVSARQAFNLAVKPLGAFLKKTEFVF